ncbi:MAG: RNA 2',3'-cyclic phosphodiesterase [Acidimicrobiia bacterium]
MTRAFVAVVPPAEVLDAIDALGRPPVPGARWSTRAQWHVTLQFLGNRADVEAVTVALGALSVGGGPVCLGGAGAFPSERRGRVLWVGAREGGPLLVQLSAAVGALLRPLGHDPEAREYHPHVTLARCKTPTDLREVVAGLADGPVGPAWDVRDVVLFESRTRREGAEYLERARFGLGPEA